MKLTAFILLLAFFTLLFIKTVTLRRKGVKAIVFGQTHKSDFLLLSIFVVFIYTVLSFCFNWPYPAIPARPLFNIGGLQWAGAILAAGALVWFGLSLYSFGQSFRVGIDTHNPDKLVTSGMFAISRNPIYVAFWAYFMGLFLIRPNIVMLALWVCVVIFTHRQVLREEAFLQAHYGAEYEAYAHRVRRYL